MLMLCIRYEQVQEQLQAYRNLNFEQLTVTLTICGVTNVKQIQPLMPITNYKHSLRGQPQHLFTRENGKR